MLCRVIVFIIYELEFKYTIYRFTLKLKVDELTYNSTNRPFPTHRLIIQLNGLDVHGIYLIHIFVSTKTNTMKISIITIVCSLIIMNLSAQQAVKGKLYDEKLNPIPAAVVSVFNSDKTEFVKAGITEDDGSFIIKNLENGTYMLNITSLGYKTYDSQPFTISNSTKGFGNIIMKDNSQALDEVVVKAEKPMVQVMADKTVFNVQNTLSATGDSGFELLRKAPGVLIDNNDAIIVEGKAGAVSYTHLTLPTSDLV